MSLSPTLPRPISPHPFVYTLLPYILSTPPYLPNHLLSHALKVRHSLLTLSSSEDPTSYLQWSADSRVEEIRTRIEEMGIDGVRVEEDVRWMIELQDVDEDEEDSNPTNVQRTVFCRLNVGKEKDDEMIVAIVLTWEMTREGEGVWKFFDLRLPASNSALPNLPNLWMKSYEEAMEVAEAKRKGDEEKKGDEDDYWGGYDDDEDDKLNGVVGNKNAALQKEDEEDNYWAQYGTEQEKELTKDPPKSEVFYSKFSEDVNGLLSGGNNVEKVDEEAGKSSDGETAEVVTVLSAVMRSVGRQKFLKGLKKFGKDEKIWQELLEI